MGGRAGSGASGRGAQNLPPLDGGLRRASLWREIPRNIVGTVRKYSDRLLELRARALLPAYRDAAALTDNKRIMHDVDVGLLGDGVTLVAMRLVGTSRPPELTMIEGRPVDDA